MNAAQRRAMQRMLDARMERFAKELESHQDENIFTNKELAKILRETTKENHDQAN